MTNARKKIDAWSVKEEKNISCVHMSGEKNFPTA